MTGFIKVVTKVGAIVLCCIAFAATADAHVMLDAKTAKIGSTLHATFSVGHGCAGSPTIKLQIAIPPGVTGVAPEAKSGWEVKSVVGPYERPYSVHGEMVKEGVTEVIWSGLLPAHEVGKFALTFDISNSSGANRKLYFPVVQECQKGIVRWIDRSDDTAEFPAPSLLLLGAH